MTINSLILETLRRVHADKNDIYALAGQWSKAEADAFDIAVAPFSKIEARR